MIRKANDKVKITRRGFVGGAMALPFIVPGSVLGADGAVAPSERIVVGLIGKGVMGNGHLHRLVGDKGVQVLGVCEVDRLRREQAKKVVENYYMEDLNGDGYLIGQRAQHGYVLSVKGLGFDALHVQHADRLATDP